LSRSKLIVEDDTSYTSILKDQERMPPHAPLEALLAGDRVCTLMFETPEGRELTTLLDENVPTDALDDFFAVDLIVYLISFLRFTDDLSVLCRLLADKDLKVVGEFGAHLFELVDRLNRRIPKWRLNGWSYKEIAERAKDDPTLPVLEPVPSQLPDFSADDASGFAWPTDEDEDGPFWTTSYYGYGRSGYAEDGFWYDED